MPAILTCVLNKQLCENPTDDHWALRDYGARLVAQICDRYVCICKSIFILTNHGPCRFGQTYENLQARVSKTYHQAFIDPSRPYTTQYGAIIGMGFILLDILSFVNVKKE